MLPQGESCVLLYRVFLLSSKFTLHCILPDKKQKPFKHVCFNVSVMLHFLSSDHWGDMIGGRAFSGYCALVSRMGMRTSYIAVHHACS